MVVEKKLTEFYLQKINKINIKVIVKNVLILKKIHKKFIKKIFFMNFFCYKLFSLY